MSYVNVQIVSTEEVIDRPEVTLNLVLDDAPSDDPTVLVRIAPGHRGQRKRWPVVLDNLHLQEVIQLAEALAEVVELGVQRGYIKRLDASERLRRYRARVGAEHQPWRAGAPTSAAGELCVRS